MFFVSTNFSIHSYLVHKSKHRKNNYIIKRLRSFNYSLLFVLIQQITVTFISNSNRKYNVVTSEIQTKDTMRQKNLGKILKRFIVTVDMSWLEHFLKFNKQGCEIRMFSAWKIFWKLICGGISMRDMRIRKFRRVKRCVNVITYFIWRRLKKLYIFSNFLYVFLMCVQYFQP